jgi:hypothetical protein
MTDGDGAALKDVAFTKQHASMMQMEGGKGRQSVLVSLFWCAIFFVFLFILCDVCVCINQAVCDDERDTVTHIYMNANSP